MHLSLPIMDTGTRPILDPKKDSAFDPECENIYLYTLERPFSEIHTSGIARVDGLRIAA